MYSEKTQRQLDRYTRKLVRSQPRWIRKLFDSEKVFFVVDKTDGSLGIMCTEKLPEKVKDRLSLSISRYMDEHPCVAIKKVEVQ